MYVRYTHPWEGLDGVIESPGARAQRATIRATNQRAHEAEMAYIRRNYVGADQVYRLYPCCTRDLTPLPDDL